ncbi:MAG TPA: hypothetical protein VF799_09655 [Geobacteraceae bacterium]
MKEVLCRGDRKRSHVAIIDRELANQETCICEHLAKQETEESPKPTL